MNTPSAKVVFLGCPLDPDEKHDSIQEKCSAMRGMGTTDDPYEAVMEIIRREVRAELWEEKGSVSVSDWLRPVPPPEERSRVTAEQFVDFIDRDGCRTFADRLAVWIDEILPAVPCLIGVDHSLTGGTLRPLARRYGAENLAVVILDSHTDAVPMPVLSDAIQYDIETNPASVYDRNDPLLYHRADSYNASSFLHHLLMEEVVLPRNLYLIGVGDFPDKRAVRIRDERMARYVGVYTALKKRGVTLVTKKECLVNPSKVKTLLGRMSQPYLYVSVDMDIGARNAVEGVRFRDRQGLQERQIYALVDILRGILSRGTRLAGLDVVEFNPRRAGSPFSGGDPTYRIAANLIERIAFGMALL